MMSPTENFEHQVDQWIQQENKFIQMLMANTMSYYEVKVVYRNFYIPTMRYMMPFTNVKKGVIKNITSKSTNLFLNKVGYAGSIAWAVVYGSVKIGG